MRQNAAHGFVEINQSARIALNIFTSLLMALCPIWAPSSRIALTTQQRSRLEPLEQATKLSAAATQAVALNLLDEPPRLSRHFLLCQLCRITTVDDPHGPSPRADAWETPYAREAGLWLIPIVFKMRRHGFAATAAISEMARLRIS